MRFVHLAIFGKETKANCEKKMSTVDKIIEDVEGQLAKGRREEPERALLDLIRDMERTDLEKWQYDLRSLFSNFQKKRSRALNEALDAALGIAGGGGEPGQDEDRDAAEHWATLLQDLKESLEDLSNHHIFQWSTFYQESLFPRLTNIVEFTALESDFEEVGRVISDHSFEIFTKGYKRLAEDLHYSHASVVSKSLSGLRHFLELLTLFHSQSLAGEDSPLDVILSRKFISKLLRGVLDGYGRVKFQRNNGFHELSVNEVVWAPYMPFMQKADIGEIISSMPDHDFPMAKAISPMCGAVDLLMRTGEAKNICVAPIVSDYVGFRSRFEVSLIIVPDDYQYGSIDVYLYLSDYQVTKSDLQEAISKGVEIVCGDLVYEFPGSGERAEINQMRTCSLSDIERTSSEAERRLLAVLQSALFDRVSARNESEPLRFNHARNFPLSNPEKARWLFHVRRTSVRALFRSFDRENGVKLWCSIRRSGKTTACYDLEGDGDKFSIVNQTCDQTREEQTSFMMFERICQALDECMPIKNEFFSALVNESLPMGTKQGRRIVLIIDEYETLFSRIMAAVRRNPDVRYYVAQPLLNQIAVFSRSNLVVFLGQQPNAHYIMMDQNQLSAYIQQNPFPLFEHHRGTTSGELSEFLGKVVGQKLSFDSGFADAVFDLTGGHPYLTVNLMVDFIDWVIVKKLPGKNLRFKKEHLECFCAERLVNGKCMKSPEYEFFRNAIAEAIGIYGKESNPWLYVVYRVLQRISAMPDMQCTEAEFENICTELDVNGFGMNSMDILRTADMANFLQLRDEVVSPKIRLLGYISVGVRPRISL